MKHILLVLLTTIIGGGGCSANSNAQRKSNVSIEQVNMQIDIVNNLIFYYPNFSRIGLAVEQMPSQEHQDVLFCAAAAFTHAIQQPFSHTNIDGNHVVDGKYYKGAIGKANTGAFAYYNKQWKFLYKHYAHELYSATQYADGMMFGQCMLIYNGQPIPMDSLPSTLANGFAKKAPIPWRTLCEKEERLCIVESTKSITFSEYLALLGAAGITHALYLDGNAGWNYSWYRDNDGRVVIIHKKTACSANCTNWITFYK